MGTSIDSVLLHDECVDLFLGRLRHSAVRARDDRHAACRLRLKMPMVEFLCEHRVGGDEVGERSGVIGTGD